jgi:ATP-dependent protease HslVU (ClpYQ) peptidase subunit
MTCIAYDGTTLAADRRVCYGGTICETTKIFRIDGCLVGGAGEMPYLMAMFEWVRNGRIIADYPEHQKHKEDWQPMLLVEPDGTACIYERSPYPVRYAQKHAAIGTGREYARAAMHLGKTAREAVEVACALDTSCGNGIDTLTLAG